jgi:hypothetical protein
VGHGGAEAILDIPMSPDEMAAFRTSGEILEERLRAILT